MTRYRIFLDSMSLFEGESDVSDMYSATKYLIYICLYRMLSLLAFSKIQIWVIETVESSYRSDPKER